MDGLIGGVDSTWAWLTMSTSATYVATAVLLVMFLALHVCAVQVVVRPLTRPAGSPQARIDGRRERLETDRRLQSNGATVERFAAGAPRLVRTGHGAQV